MKNLNLFIRNVLPSGQKRQFAGAAIIYVMALLLPGRLFAQAPVISYSSPQVYTAGTAISALTPVVNGTVAAPGYSGTAVNVAGGFFSLGAIAADAAGNVYVTDSGDGDSIQPAVYKISTGGGKVSIGSGFNTPTGVAVDALGNVYVADNDGTLKKIAANDGGTTVVASGLFSPELIAVDAAGNIYVADTNNNAVKKILAVDGSITTIGSGFNHPIAVAIDATGNVYVTDASNRAVKKIPAGGGSIITLASGSIFGGLAVNAAGDLYVVDVTNNAVVEIPPGGTIKTIANINTHVIALDGAGNLYFLLGSATIAELKPTGGYYISQSLPAGLNFNSATGVISGTPTATGGSPATNYTVTAYNGAVSGQATINLTVNPLAPVISYTSPQLYTAGTAITALTPAGNGVVAPQAYNSTAITFASGASSPSGIATDKAGNVYITDQYQAGHTAVYKIPAGGGIPVSIGSGFTTAHGLVVDDAGNVYVTDGGNPGFVKKIAASDGSTTVVATGFYNPAGVARDAAGNIYVADQNNNAVKKILAADGSISTIGSGFNSPAAVAVDAAGNVYVADTGNNAVKEIPAGGGSVITLASGALFVSLALDGAGNIYSTDLTHKVIAEIPAGGALITISSLHSTRTAVDGAGNLYFITNSDNLIHELKPTGGYYINPVLPAGLNFNSATGAISGTPIAAAPATNYTVTGYNITGSDTATVNITVNPLTVNYSSPQVYNAGTAITALAPVVNGTVAAPGYNSTAAAFANVSLPVVGVAADAAGNIYAATSDGSQSAVIKIAAGGGSQVSIGSGFGRVNGVAVDRAGNVYVSDITAGSVKKIAASDGSTTTLASGFNNPGGLAVDAAGNIYVADQSNNAVKEIQATGGSVITIGSGFSSPKGVAIDAAGNIYVADFGNKAVKEIPAGGGAITTLASGFLVPGLTVDAAGNIFVTDLSDLVIDEIPAGGTIKTIANIHALNVAVDGAGNLYTADAGAGSTSIITYKPTGGYYTGPLPAGLSINTTTGVISGTPTIISPATDYTVTAYNGAISGTATVNITVNPLAISYSSPQVYSAGTAITALTPVVNGTVAAPGYNNPAVTVAGGFSHLNGVVADAAGNIYVSDYAVAGSAPPVVYKIPANGGARVSIGTGLVIPLALTVDQAGNVYVMDNGDGTIKKIAANGGATTIVASGFFTATGLAVDAAGNIYVADTNHNAVKILAADGSVITIGSGLNRPTGVAVDNMGNVYVADNGNQAVKEIPAGGGSIITLASGSLFAALTLDAAGNVYVTDATQRVTDEIPAGGTIKTIANVYSPAITVDGAGNLYFMDVSAGNVREFKPTGGHYISPFLPAGLSFDSTTGVISGTPTTPSPATNYTVTAYNSVSSGQATVNIAVNPLTIAYTTPQVYTAGTAITALAPAVSGTVAAPGYRTPVSIGSGFNGPTGVAVDNAGNVYVGDYFNNAVKVIPFNGGSPQVIGSGFNNPDGVAIDAAGNIYVADKGNNAIKKISNFGAGAITSIGSGFNQPTGVAVDALGNVFVADANNIKEIPAGGGAVLTLGSGFNAPAAVAVDAVGNIYVADYNNNAVKEIVAGSGTILTLGSGFSNPYGVAVDAAGNVYVGDRGNNAVKVIPYGTGSPVNIGTGFNQPTHLTVDAGGNVYVGDYGNSLVKKFTPAGGYHLSNALPRGLSFDNTTGVISGTPIAANPATNYIVTAYNSASSGTATVNITVNPLTVSYSSPQVYSAGTAVTALAPTVNGTVAAQGYSGAPVTFAGGFAEPNGIAADAAGNIYVTDLNITALATDDPNAVVYKIPAAGGSAIIIGTGFNIPYGLAVDRAGNVYVADASVIRKIAAIGGATTIVASGFNFPVAVAVDAAGNIYVADTYNNAVKEVLAADGSVNAIGSGFNQPAGIAVDAMGNVYVADSGNSAVKEILVGGGGVITLASGSQFGGLTLDAAGNIYVTDVGNGVIDEIPAGGTIKTIANMTSSSITLDGAGNLYVLNSGLISELKPAGGYYISPFLPAGLNFNSTTGVISGTPTVASPATNYTVTAYNSASSGQGTVNITVNPPAPSISTSGTLPALTTTYGTASSSASFNVSGANMTAGILVKPPTGFEVSTDNSAFSNTVTIGSAGTVASTPVYVRLKATNAAGSYSGNIVLSSTGATDVSLATVSSAVNGAPLTITASNVNKNYGTAITGATGSTAYSITSGSLKNGNTINSVTIAYGTGSAATDAVNTYTSQVTPSLAIGANGFVASNYNITYAKGNIIVGKAPLTLTAKIVSKNYGSTLTGGSGSKAYNITSGSLKNGNTISSLTIAYGAGAAATDAVNTYTGSVTLSAVVGANGFLLSNYNISYANGDIIVGAEPITITAKNVNKTYGSTLTGGTGSKAYGITSGQLKNGNTIASLTIAYGAGATATDAVNTYTGSVTPSAVVGANGFLLSNYNITYANGDIIVGAEPITITAKNVNKTYGSTLTGGTGSKAYGITSGQLKNGNTISSLTIVYGSGAAATDAVNTYTGSVTPSAVVGANGFLLSNYNITYASGDIIVGAEPITITARNVNKTYGSTITGAAGSKAYSITSGQLKNGNTISSVTIAYGTGSAATATVNTYIGAVTQSAAVGANGFLSTNYNITYIKGNIIVNPKSLTVTAANKSITYGSAVPALTIGYAGFANSEGASNFTSQPTISTTGTAVSPVGTYPITVSGAADSNYTISYVPGTLTIGAAPLTIKANNVNKPQGNALTGGPGSTAFSITSGSLQNGETVSSVTIAYGTGALASAALGTYIASVTPSAVVGANGFLSSNYQITYAKGDIVVAKPVITATGSLVALSTMQGTPSVSSAFTVSGASIAAGILVTAPPGFEVSTDNVNFGNSLTIAGTNTLPAAPVYVRLAAADNVGNYTGNVVLTGLNAVSVNVPTVKSTVNPLLPYPVVQARLVTFTNTTSNGTTVSWTNGSGAGRVVFMRLISSGSALPGNGTLYTANTIFGSGTEIGTTGWYCIYNGTGNSVNVSGLAQGTTYRVTVLEYTGTPADAAYLETNPPATAPNYLEARVSPANVTTAAIYPVTPARLVTFSNTTSTSTTASWTNGDGTARAVFMELTGTGSVVLTDGTTYTANTSFGAGSTVVMSGKPFYCIYNGTGNSVNITGLIPSTLYRVTVVEYKGGAGSQMYLNTGQSPSNVTTGAPPLNSLVLPKDNGEATPLISSFNSEKIEANNILSPNGDGVNDIWVVKNIAFYPNNTVTVYDRAGKIVFTKKGYTNDWDGTYRGSVVNEGTYYYLIDLGNGTTAKGFITVVKDR